MQPPGASLQITRQQLADELRATLTSTHRFSQYCLPLLIEKISSDLQAAKQDSLQTLVSSCPYCLLTLDSLVTA